MAWFILPRLFLPKPKPTNKKSPGGQDRGFLQPKLNKTGVQYAKFNRIDDSRQVGGETMTIRTRRDDTNYRNLNNKDWQGDSAKRIALRSTPQLCQPFIKQGEFHYLFFHEDIKAHLSYNRLDELWTVRFTWIEDGEEIEAGFYPEIQTVQYPRDMPVAEMLEALIEVIDNRWQNDGLNWMKF